MNTLSKHQLLNELFKSKYHIHRDRLIVADTNQSLPLSVLNRKLCLLSAMINRKLFGNKWQKHKERIVFYCFNEKSPLKKHTHSHILLGIPNGKLIEKVLMYAKHFWWKLGNFINYNKKKQLYETSKFTFYSKKFDHDLDRAFYRNCYYSVKDFSKDSVQVESGEDRFNVV